jgi:hypothetical protein
MAVGTGNLYFSNSIVGVPRVGADIDIYETAAAAKAKYAVGFGFERADGAKFRYGIFGGTVTGGMVVAGDASDTSKVDTDNVIKNPGTASAIGAEALKPGSQGSHYVQATLASVTADHYAGGYLVITDGTGAGLTYRIKGNTATNDPITGDVRLELYEPLAEPVDMTSDLAIQGSKYNDLVACTAATDLVVAGVACADNAAGSYGWVQTRGICAVLTDSTTIAAGDTVSISSTGDGYIQAWGTNGTDAGSGAALMIAEQPLGTVAILGDATGHSVLDLTLLE